MTSNVIQFSVERQDDGDPRISDSELAERLGYSDVHDFRALIKRHIVTLKRFGFCRAVRETHGRAGGRPGIRYSLTEHQATFLVTQSQMPTAVDITVGIIEAFVAYRRGAVDPKLYGAVGMELLGFTPRAWEREYQPQFFDHLHRVHGWTRPAGNNHSNCAHFINRFVYEFLFGELGLAALKDANPSDDGQRAHKHHQMLKDKHMPRLRTHIQVVTALLAGAVSAEQFEDNFNYAFPKPNTQIGFLFGETRSAMGA